MKKLAILCTVITFILLLVGCGQEPTNITPTELPVIEEDNPIVTQEDKPAPTVTIEVGPPKPINAVLMLSTMGYCWYRTPPEDLWTLRSVTFDVKSFLPGTVHLDKAIVEVAGQVEVVPLDIDLDYKEYTVYTIPIVFIDGILSGEYDLEVSLRGEGFQLCSRIDRAKVYWPGD